jgi:hypothetical protein
MTLGAADAWTPLRNSLPFVLDHITATQLDHMQLVLDAAVLDPEIKKEALDFWNRSFVGVRERLNFTGGNPFPPFNYQQSNSLPLPY